MADAMISPAVGGTLWAAAAGLIAVCARRVRRAPRDERVPLMGVLGAFVFTAQMINFSIPGTGSSGHLSGGLLLAVLLGPSAALLVMASVLTMQALFFADGGLLALGCNMINLGFVPAFLAYPLFYRPIARQSYGTPRAWLAAIAAAVVGLQMGAFGVVLETTVSGMAALPFRTFVLMLLPIHLAIGVLEGLATAGVVAFVARTRPEALPEVAATPASGGGRALLMGLALAAIVLGGAGSWFASTHPDGLEWAIDKVTGHETLAPVATGAHRGLAGVQAHTTLLPDYGFRSAVAWPAATPSAAPESDTWPAVNAGTSLAGIVGGCLTLALVCLVGFVLKCRPNLRP